MDEKQSAMRHITMTLAPIGVHDLETLTYRVYERRGLSSTLTHPAVLYAEAVKACQGFVAGAEDLVHISDSVAIARWRDDIGKIHGLCNPDHLLRTASKAGELEAVEAALDLGANPNGQDLLGHAAIHFAVGDHHRHLIKPLVEAGADVNLQAGGTGYAPLHMAARSGDAKTCLLLMAHGADANLKDDLGRTPIELALRELAHEHEHAPAV